MASRRGPAPATPALAALIAAGVPHQIHEYEVPAGQGRDHDRRPHYAQAAAAALGVDPARVFKTLVASVDGSLAVAVVPASAELDLRALAGVLGGRRAELAAPAEAERATGYVIGGISPLGQRRHLPMVIDASADGFPTILVSAGRRGLQVELRAADLAGLGGALRAAIARPG